MADATIKQTMEFFGFTSAGAFMKDWKQLSELEQQQLKVGIGNGSLAY